MRWQADTHDVKDVLLLDDSGGSDRYGLDATDCRAFGIAARKLSVNHAGQTYFYDPDPAGGIALTLPGGVLFGVLVRQAIRSAASRRTVQT